jgi:hypothetical protein
MKGHRIGREVLMRCILPGIILLLGGCDGSPGGGADARYIAHFRAEGVQACMQGEGLMQPHWAVPPERLQQSCECIVAAFTEGKTPRELRHLTVGDELRARERCSNGAPIGAGPGDEMDMNEVMNAMIGDAGGEGNAGEGKR